jgi:hypothetical protein
MTTAVRQIQLVQGEVAANKMLADGWVYLNSVPLGSGVAHVLGHEVAARFEDKILRVHRDSSTEAAKTRIL